MTHRLDGPADAPPLVLSNSLGTSIELWDGQLPALSDRFRVLRYEHRGHGGSPAPPGPYSIADLAGDLVALLDRLGLERVSFCGASIGGMVGLWLAIHEPERIDRLALCCSSAHMPPAETMIERAATVRSEGMDAVADAALERWFSPGFRERQPDTVARIRATLVACDPEGYAGCCEAIAGHDLRAELGAIRAPTLVIAADDDPATPPEHGRLIADSVPDARLVVLHGARHLANVECAEEVNRELLGHLNLEDRGMRVRREVLGDEWVDAAAERTSDFTADFQDLITRYAWGEIWDRPGLDRRMRSAITLTALIARGQFDELGPHVRAALRNGLTEDEIKEVLLQSAIYCGMPAANSAFGVAQRVLEEESG